MNGIGAKTMLDRIYSELPENIKKYQKRHIVNIAINFNMTDGLNGYGQILHRNVVMSAYHIRCNRCGYDNLFNPGAWYESKCGHHTYEEDYAEVFAWSDTENDESLEECFSDWESIQGNALIDPVVFKTYGEI